MRALSHSILVLILFITACTLTQTEAQTVYITKTGSKYHTANCRYLKYSQFPISLKEAKQKGYTPCSVCKPPTANTSSSQSIEAAPSVDTVKVGQTIKEPVKNVEARQCTAITKAGTRCKRTTKNANQRCWQHQ